jgi:hypothetical protein
VLPAIKNIYHKLINIKLIKGAQYGACILIEIDELSLIGKGRQFVARVLNRPIAYMYMCVTFSLVDLNVYEFRSQYDPISHIRMYPYRADSIILTIKRYKYMLYIVLSLNDLTNIGYYRYQIMYDFGLVN